MALWGVLLLCSMFSVNGVLLKTKGEQFTLYHFTATFGPSSGAYDVSAAPVIAIPPILCGKEDPLEKTIMVGKIVLVQRGDCPFLEKALRAQKNGALGVIVGDPENDALFRMNYSPNASQEAANLAIPCVSTSWTSFRLISNAVDDPKAVVTLNDEGDYTSTSGNEQGEVLRFAGVLLLSLPCLWCVTAAGYVLFKKLTYRRDRRLRLAMGANLPEVPYRRTSESNAQVADVAMSDRVHNDSCAICLDEFNMDEPIALLPCCHGFHRRCLDPWLDRSALCPICKQSILDTPITVAIDNQVVVHEPDSVAMVSLSSSTTTVSTTTTTTTTTTSSSTSSSTAPLLAFEDSAGPLSPNRKEKGGSKRHKDKDDDEEEGHFAAL